MLKGRHQHPKPAHPSMPDTISLYSVTEPSLLLAKTSSVTLQVPCIARSLTGMLGACATSA